MENLQQYIDQGIALGMTYAPKLLLAIIVLIVGMRIIGSFTKFMESSMKKREMDASLIPFLKSITGTLLKALLLISAASMIGIETTSFVAIIGAAGLAIGLALQGSLSNFAGGVLIIIFKPYKVGHFVMAQGHSGTVKEIQVFNTVLTSVDNKRIIIPNGAMANGSIVNVSAEDRRRVDLVFGIGYDDDLQKAKDILQKLIDADERVLKDPSAFIAVKELGASSVDIVVRMWCEKANYWGIYHDMLETVKLTFDKEGISIPYPQQDTHIYNHGAIENGAAVKV